MSDVRKVIIIDSGPAGGTAAICAARAQLDPLAFEGEVTAGGGLMSTSEVEDLPGFLEGIQAPALMENRRAQAERVGTERFLASIEAAETRHDPARVMA